MNRIFLNWDKPLLQTAADYFVERFTRNGCLVLRNVVIAVSGTQAGLRLEELLAERAETMNEPAWFPPEIITFGQLPEKFYDQKKDFADELTQAGAWLDAVVNAPVELNDFLPKLPEDILGRLRLGQMFVKLHKELTAEDLDFNAVAQKCAELQLGGEYRRWNALADLQEHYLAQLDALNIWDRYSAIRYAISAQSTEEKRSYVERFRQNGTQFFLLGVADMNKVQKDILSKFKEFITPIVFAPERYKDAFDEFGCLKPERWDGEPIPLEESQIIVTEDVQGQADEVLRSIAGLKGQYPATDIVVGVPDTEVIPVLEQRFERADLKMSYVRGLPIRRTNIFRLLEILPELAGTGGNVPYRHFAEFLRHPDVEFFVRQSAKVTENNLLTLWDTYHAEHLPESVDEHFLDDAFAENQTDSRRQSERLRVIWDAVQKIISPADSKGNRERLNLILQQFYGDSVSPYTDKALTLVRQSAESVTKIPERFLSGVSFSDFVRLTSMLSEDEFIPPFSKTDAVELSGWLDLPMNDAPVVILTGMNDGTVPSYVNEDMFLPDHLRRALNITDNRRRIARDAYNLLLILNTRQKSGVKLTMSRRSVKGDALLPSRLFFAADVQTVCRRAKRFFAEPSRTPPLCFSGEIQTARKFNFTVPLAEPIGDTIEAMSVTDFKYYKECPYRFYLKQKRLQHIHDTDEELPPNAFGTLLHKTLELFGQSEYKDSADAAPIERHVKETFDALARHQYGSAPKAAVLLQFEMAKQRLMTFAKKQAERRRLGWRIIATETRFTKEDGIVIGDGIKPMYLKGRIDRIDQNENTGGYAVLDYKIKDSVKSPEEVHYNKKKGQWLDFQLPLYDFLLRRSSNILPDKVSNSDWIQLGYFVLPKDDEGGVKLWGGKKKIQNEIQTELAEAVAECRSIAEKVRNNQFELSADPPQYDDFPEICVIGMKQ